MDSLNFRLLLQEKSRESQINSLSEENMSFLIKKSIIRLFGELYVGKFYFTLKTINEKENIFNISFISDYKNKLLTALLLISDLEYNIRVVLCK